MSKLLEYRLVHCEFNAQELVYNYPGRPSDRNKKVLWAASCPPGATHWGNLSFSRWSEMLLPESVTRQESPRIVLNKGFFDYGEVAEGHTDWHLNFAHFDLFCAYPGRLFAQDEMQVAEHPALASLRHALLAAGLQPLCVEHGRPTPALIRNVERRLAIATNPDPSQGRPHGLYGNSFSREQPDVIRRAITVLDPPSKSNILAIEAPQPGHGSYTRKQLEFILSTAWTGFFAARYESLTEKPGNTVGMHTGYWGCGAYGGNRLLMPFLQFVAACGAGLDELVFHTGGDDQPFHQALALFNELVPVGETISLPGLLKDIEELDFQWGLSDGN